MEWAGRQAVVALPEHIGISNAGRVREELLSVINRGAQVLIADMTTTISCDHAGADAMIRAWQRAVGSGTELRLVVTSKIVSRVLHLRGLDRLVSVYPFLEAAMAARPPAAAAAIAAVFPTAAPSAGSRTTDHAELPGPPAGPLEDPAAPARDAAAAERECLQLLNAATAGMVRARLGLQATLNMPGDVARQRTEEILGDLDDIIRQIRGTAFLTRDQPVPSARARLPAATVNAGGRSQAAHGTGIARRGPRPASRPADTGSNTLPRPSGERTT